MDESDGPRKTFFALHWRGIVIFIVPLLFLPVILIDYSQKEFRCLYILIVMAVYWITESMPLYVTAMIPIFAFPLLDILDTDATVLLYFKDTFVMFLGGMMMALAIEYSNLHKRLALRTIKVVGCSPRRLHFGLIFVTAFMSMWISNAAATAMMLPIITAVLEELQAQGLCKMYKDVPDNLKGRDDEPPYPTKITLCYYLGVAYASSMGGCGTLIGTPTNLSLKELYDIRFPDSTESIDFPIFMFYAMPPMIVFTFLMFIWLQWLYMGLFRPKSEEAEAVRMGKEGAKIAEEVINQRYTELGPMSIHEIQVMILFILLIAMFFTRRPNFFPGWADYLSRKDFKVGNSVPSLLTIVLCFMLPANYKFLRYIFGRAPANTRPTSSLISWKFIHSKTPWGLIFLCGGGFSLAEGSKRSGMAKMIGNALEGMENLPNQILLLVVMIFTVFLTAFSSNVAIANIIIPVLMEMALAIEVHPLYLVFPAGLACSLAFHLPVSTPPNAIVAGYANIRTKDMALAGIGPTVAGVLTLYVFGLTWGLVVFPNLNTFPEWAQAHARNASL